MNDEELIARLNVENGRGGRVPRKYKLMLLIAADNFFPMRVIYYFFIAFLFGICWQKMANFCIFCPKIGVNFLLFSKGT